MGFVFTNWLLSFLRPNSSSCLSFIYLFSITLFSLCSVHHEMWFVCLVLMLLSSWGGLVFYWCFYDLSLHSLLITNLTILVNASLQSYCSCLILKSGCLCWDYGTAAIPCLSLLSFSFVWFSDYVKIPRFTTIKNSLESLLLVVILGQVRVPNSWVQQPHIFSSTSLCSL